MSRSKVFPDAASAVIVEPRMLDPDDIHTPGIDVDRIIGGSGEAR